MKIGVVIPLGRNEHLGRPRTYQEVRELALALERAGFDSVWLYDHLLYRRPGGSSAGVQEVWTFLSALGEATSRVELGTLVLCTVFRNPALTAKMAAALDDLTGGRLILGLGAGWNKPEFDAFGYPFDHLASRFEESLEIIAPLLKEGRVDFRGRYYSAEDCELNPRPSRPGGPPVLVASSGPRMLRITARYADMWNTAWYGKASGTDGIRREMEEACRAVGRDPSTLEVTVGVKVGYPEIAGPEEMPRDYLTGSAEEVAAGLDEYRRAGVGHVICWCAPDTTEAVTRLTEVFHAYKRLG